MNKHITLLYFAWVREAVGVAQETLLLPDSLSTAQDLADWLATRGENYAQVFHDTTKLCVAYDQELVKMEMPLGNVVEIAFFPPMTGG
jgi:sulfur-carrier protein